MKRITDCKMRIISAFISAMLGFVLFIFAPLSAFAMNLDYLKNEKWENNPNVTVEAIEGRRAMDYELGGNFGYYVDDYMTIHTLFSINESTLKNDGSDNVWIIFDYTMPSETYSFSVNGEGIADTDDGAVRQCFTTAQNFGDGAIGRYFAAVQYVGKESECTVNISLSVNGHTYKNIAKNIRIELPTTVTTTKPTTTKAPKTTKAKTKKKKAKTAKKQGKSKTKKSEAKATKYVPTGTTALELEDIEDETTTEITETFEYTEDFREYKTQLPSGTRSIILAVIVLAVLGILALFYSFSNKEKES